MNDIFDEAEEDLRAREWTQIAQKSWPYVAGALGAALIIAVAVWGYSVWQESITNKASETYAEASETLATDKAKAKTLFTEVSQKGNDGYKALSLMQLAAMSLEENKPDEALKLYDQAAKASKSPNIADMAALRAVYVRLDANAPYSEIETRLKPLIKDSSGVQALAKEALGLAKVANGDFKGARADFQTLSITLGTPDAMKQRAQEYVMAIDSGTAESARQVSKAKIPELPANLGPAMGGMPQP